MVQLPQNFKENVIAALFEARTRFSGSDAQFAKQYGLNAAVYSRLKKLGDGEQIEGLVSDAKLLEVGLKLDVSTDSRQWQTVETDVFKAIHESVVFCQSYAKSMMLVDDAGIGKTYTARHLARTLSNCFYLDATQAKGKTEFIRMFARALGVDDKDKIVRVKKQIKYILRVLPRPVVIIDEAGDLDDKTFLEIKEIWNATEGCCGWFMMGADGLQHKVERNINNKKPGFTEIFSRFGERYNKIVPVEKSEKLAFYKKLISDVIRANMADISKLSEVVNKCLRNDSGKISGLRRAESLLIIHNAV